MVHDQFATCNDVGHAQALQSFDLDQPAHLSSKCVRHTSARKSSGAATSRPCHVGLLLMHLNHLSHVPVHTMHIQ